MRKIILFLVSLMCLFAFAVSASAETVAQMTYIVKMPDVIREGKYTGEVKDGIPHGYGLFVTQNSSGVSWHYIGEWVDGVMNGNGGQYWDIGQAHVGTFENNDLLCGYMRENTSQNVWIDYRKNEHGCYSAVEYREDGSVMLECCISPETGNYHKGTFYTKNGEIFFSGEIGEDFNWNLIYIE